MRVSGLERRLAGARASARGTSSIALEYIRVPILIMQGADDEYGTLEQLRAAEREATCPVETIVLADCGHAPQSDQPERTIKETARFIVHRLMQNHGEAGELRRTN